MICLTCSEDNGLLIRGECKQCNPVAHRNYTEALEDSEESDQGSEQEEEAA